MSWLRTSIFLSLVLSTAVTTVPAQASSLIAQIQPISPGGVGKLVKELNLSNDQIQRLQTLRSGAKGKTKERRQALRTAKQELAQLIQGNGSSEQIRQKRQQVQTIQREVADANFETTLAIREILTPEQRIKLQQLMQQRRQNRGKLK